MSALGVGKILEQRCDTTDDITAMQACLTGMGGGTLTPTLELLQVHSLDVSTRQMLDMSDQSVGRLSGLFWEARDEGLEVGIGP